MRRCAIAATLVLPALALFVPAAWAADGTWNTSKTDMPTERSEAATAVVGSKLYVMAGYNGGYLKEHEVYDPGTNTWDVTRTDVWTARRGPAIGAVNGKIYVIGGRHQTRGYIADNEEYDTSKAPGSDNWAIVTAMPTPRGGAAYATVNDKIYVIGGTNGSRLSVCQVYDPADGTNGSWSTMDPMPTAREEATASVVNGKIYVIGGYDSSGYSGKCEAFDPNAAAGSQWTTMTPMPTPRCLLASGAVNGRIYVVGGYDGNDSIYPVVNEEFDPVGNSWIERTGAPLPASRRGLTAGVVNGKLYVFGGDFGTAPWGGPYRRDCWEYTPPVTNIAPSITTQPESVTVNAGETAEFTVAADGSPAPTYQWQKSTDGGGNWTDISGATGTTYTTPATVPADDGTRFRCVASNVAGDAYSQAAVLSIRTTFTIPLAAGYNLIALPFEPATPYTASLVLADINASGTIATRALMYNGTGYDVYTEGGGGINFDIVVGMGFFVRCTAAGSWTVTPKD